MKEVKNSHFIYKNYTLIRRITMSKIKYTHYNIHTGELVFFDTTDPLYPIPSDTHTPIPFHLIPSTYKPL